MFKNRGENSAFGGGLRAPGGFRGPRFQKFKKPRIQNDGPNTHPKFQHSSLITKCLKIGFWGGFKSPRGFQGTPGKFVSRRILNLNYHICHHAKFQPGMQISREKGLSHPTSCSLIDFDVWFFWCNQRNLKNHWTFEAFRKITVGKTPTIFYFSPKNWFLWIQIYFWNLK